MVSLVLFLMLAAILEFGRATFSAQVVQQAAGVAAREFATRPFRADAIEADVLSSDEGRAVYDPAKLAVEIQAGDDLSTIHQSWPPVNQQLRPLMFVDEVGGVRYLRYPGTLVRDAESDQLIVRIPLVQYDGAGGESIARWADVVEMTNLDAESVSIEVHYPFQAATLSGFDTDIATRTQSPIRADDSIDPGDPRGELVAPDSPVDGDPRGRTYGGPLGLGAQQAFGNVYGPLRPFRKVVSGLGVFRRELFQ